MAEAGMGGAPDVHVNTEQCSSKCMPNIVRTSA